MEEKLKKFALNLEKNLPNCKITYAFSIESKDLVDFYIYYYDVMSKRKKYIEISLIIEKIDIINFELLIEDIKRTINKQKYILKEGIVIFDEFIDI